MTVQAAALNRHTVVTTLHYRLQYTLRPLTVSGHLSCSSSQDRPQISRSATYTPPSNLLSIAKVWSLQVIQNAWKVVSSELLSRALRLCNTNLVVHGMRPFQIFGGKGLIRKCGKILKNPQLETVHKCLESIQIPVDIGRLPSRIDTGATFTAEQWMNWTIYFSIIILPIWTTFLGSDRVLETFCTGMQKVMQQVH